jgi:hypothetical protein
MNPKVNKPDDPVVVPQENAEANFEGTNNSDNTGMSEDEALVDLAIAEGMSEEEDEIRADKLDEGVQGEKLLLTWCYDIHQLRYKRLLADRKAQKTKMLPFNSPQSREAVVD